MPHEPLAPPFCPLGRNLTRRLQRGLLMSIYNTLGEDRGCCGHRHLTPQRTLACGNRFRDDQQHHGDYSDRRVVAVDADAPSADGAPRSWRWLNNGELA